MDGLHGGQRVGWLDGVLGRTPTHKTDEDLRWEDSAFRAAARPDGLAIGQLGDGSIEHNKYSPVDRPWGVVPDLSDALTQTVYMEWIRTTAESDTLHLAWREKKWHIIGIPHPDGDMFSVSADTRAECVFKALMYLTG